MAKVTANNGKENYLVEIDSPSGNSIIADEPEEKGGHGKGFSPKGLLVSALAACTSATVRIFCNRKEWNVKMCMLKLSWWKKKAKLFSTGNYNWKATLMKLNARRF